MVACTPGVGLRLAKSSLALPLVYSSASDQPRTAWPFSVAYLTQTLFAIETKVIRCLPEEIALAATCAYHTQAIPSRRMAGGTAGGQGT
jgi:hypothetical protein